MLFSVFLLAVAPILAAAQTEIPWNGPFGVVPRFECLCDCGDEVTSKKITREVCKEALTTGRRKKEVRQMEDGRCAFWGIDVHLRPDEISATWGTEVCAERGCSAISQCNYVTCSGVKKTKWVPAPPAKIEADEKSEE
ncbi:hypothetical protein DRE_00386 [Drechslerella stenobrocha 248]|uniref:Uncharacterized protein n=1 Tax=Drechslerella stenobrocha 248 TaxID=1043628 RepID=W7I5F7_9PEZI|nr:hypothetical protein DRE_00386 [Drechslerella stenobrocha 248]